MRSRPANQNGYTLIATVITLMLVGYMGASLVESLGADSADTAGELQNIQALQIGNGGIQYALDKINDGLSPDTTDKPLGVGTFDVVTNPAGQTFTVTAHAGLAKKTQSVSTTFAQQCVDIDVTTASYDQKELQGIELVKTCNKAAVISDVVVEWNWSACAQALSCTAMDNPPVGADPDTGKVTICHIPPGNPANAHTISVSQNALSAHVAHGDAQNPCAVGDIDTPIVCEGYDNQIAACGADTAGAKAKSVRLAGSLLANNLTVDSGAFIGVDDTTLSADQSYVIDEIGFDSFIPNNAWFAVRIDFADGSSIRKPFKFGTPAAEETESGAFTIDDGQLTVNPNKTVKLDVLGSQITCGTGGETIPVTVELATNNSYKNLFNNQAVIGGESYSVTTASGDTFKVRGAGKLQSCGKFSESYESTNTVQVKTLKNGEKAPLLAGYGGQKPVMAFLQPYLDDDGDVKLSDKQVLMLFEIGTGGNSGSAATDFQDLVVMFTIE